jgi:hypothetical protein
MNDENSEIGFSTSYEALPNQLSSGYTLAMRINNGCKTFKCIIGRNNFFQRIFLQRKEYHPHRRLKQNSKI